MTQLSLRKQPSFRDATTGFPAKWRLRNERRNSILMTRHYPDLGSNSDWLKICFHQSEVLPRSGLWRKSKSISAGTQSSSLYGGVHVQVMEWNTLYKTQGSYRASIFSNFPDLKKVLKMEIKSEKIVKKSCIEFFSKLQQIVLYKWHVFVLVKSYLISPVCLQPIVLLITALFDNLESRKRNYCFGKKSGKVLNLFPGICAEDER